MKFWVFVFALTGAAQIAAAAAAPPLSISLGAFLPTQTDTRRRAGDALLSASVGYALPASRALPGSQTRLGVEAQRSSRGEGNTIVAGTVAQLFSATPGRSPLAPGVAYGGLGLGLYGLDLADIHAILRGGAFAEIGYNVTGEVFAAAQYRVVERGDGVTLGLGARF